MSKYNAYLQTKYFTSLDGLRCFCILAIIWHHGSMPATVISLFHRGFIGVDIFFLISGFLIVTLLLREKNKTKNINLKYFYIRRILRIFPIYYLLLLAAFFAYLLVAPNSNAARVYYQCLPFYITHTSNWIAFQAFNMGVFWSLAAEEQFYLVWPTIEKIFSKAFIMFILGLVIVINQLVNFDVFDNQIKFILGTTNLHILHTTFTPMALGVLLSHLLQNKKGFIMVDRIVGNYWMPFIFVSILLSLCQLSPSDSTGYISGMPRLLIQITIMFLLASVVIQKQYFLSLLFTLKPIRYIGQISYGMYLYHMWCFYIINSILNRLNWQNWLLTDVLSLALVVLIADLSFRLIESPILKLKSQFIA